MNTEILHRGLLLFHSLSGYILYGAMSSWLTNPTKQEILFYNPVDKGYVVSKVVGTLAAAARQQSCKAAAAAVQERLVFSP